MMGVVLDWFWTGSEVVFHHGSGSGLVLDLVLFPSFPVSMHCF